MIDPFSFLLGLLWALWVVGVAVQWRHGRRERRQRELDDATRLANGSGNGDSRHTSRPGGAA